MRLQRVVIVGAGVACTRRVQQTDEIAVRTMSEILTWCCIQLFKIYIMYIVKFMITEEQYFQTTADNKGLGFDWIN